MCNPLMLAGAVGLGAAGSIINGNSAKEAAQRDAQARNAVLAQTIAKEKGYAADNAKEFGGNIAHYAPGSQDAQLASAQAKRTATMTGNMTSADPTAVPLPADTNPAATGDLAKRMLAVHDGAVSRAGLTAKVGGYGDTWLQNNLNTNEADRNIGVTNNYAEGQKAILPALQDDAAAAAYKPPSVWGSVLSGLGGVAAGAAGGGKSIGSMMPKVDVSNVWNPIAGVTGH
jgi:hypothetical protein